MRSLESTIRGFFYSLGKDIIPELVIPHKRRVWFEDQRKVKDVSFILTAETLRRLPVNRTIVLSRGSGYQVSISSKRKQLDSWGF